MRHQVNQDLPIVNQQKRRPTKSDGVERRSDFERLHHQAAEARSGDRAGLARHGLAQPLAFQSGGKVGMTTALKQAIEQVH
jgi:hypothetical protein